MGSDRGQRGVVWCGVVWLSGCADEMQSLSLPSPAEEGTFSCQVTGFSPLVLLADCHWNMPYRSWQLSPSGPDSTLLTVNGAHLQVKVEIKVGTADLLLSPHPLPLPPTKSTHTPPRWGTCVCVCVCVDAVCENAVCENAVSDAL